MLIPSSFQGRTSSFILLCFALVLVGCSPPGAKQGSLAPSATNASLPLTKEDYEAFGKKLEKAVITQDSGTIEKCYCIENIFIRVVDGLNLSEADRHSIIKGVRQSEDSLSNKFLLPLQAIETFKFVKVKETDGKMSVLIRVITHRNVLKYQEITLVRYPDGIIGAEDIFFYEDGELLSQFLRQRMLKLIAENEKVSLGNLKKSDSLFLEYLGKLSELQTASQKQDLAKALVIYDSMPAEFRDQKEVLRYMISAASQTDLEQYRKFIDRFRQLYPKNVALDSMLIGYHASNGEHGKVIECFGKLIDSVGGDPELNYLRAQVLIQVKRYKEAREDLETAVSLDPTMTKAYPALIDFVVQGKDHPATLKWLKQGIENKAFNPNEEFFRTTEIYQDFVKSAQFSELVQWLNARKK